MTSCALCVSVSRSCANGNTYTSNHPQHLGRPTSSLRPQTSLRSRTTSRSKSKLLGTRLPPPRTFHNSAKTVTSSRHWTGRLSTKSGKLVNPASSAVPRVPRGACTSPTPAAAMASNPGAVPPFSLLGGVRPQLRRHAQHFTLVSCIRCCERLVDSPWRLQDNLDNPDAGWGTPPCPLPTQSSLGKETPASNGYLGTLTLIVGSRRLRSPGSSFTLKRYSTSQALSMLCWELSSTCVTCSTYSRER